jgi:hypothetical protein
MTAKNKLQREIEHYDTIAGKSAPAGAAGVQKNRARSVVYSLRLNPEDIAELERVAAELDVPAASLARGYVLDGLAEHRVDDPARMIDKIQSELGVVHSMLRGTVVASKSRARGRAG